MTKLAKVVLIIAFALCSFAAANYQFKATKEKVKKDTAALEDFICQDGGITMFDGFTYCMSFKKPMEYVCAKLNVKKFQEAPNKEHYACYWDLDKSRREVTHYRVRDKDIQLCVQHYRFKYPGKYYSEGEILSEDGRLVRKLALNTDKVESDRKGPYHYFLLALVAFGGVSVCCFKFIK